MTTPEAVAWGAEGLLFNAKDGFLEGIIRGCKGGLLTPQDYSNLTQCETLDDVKLHLVSESITGQACFCLEEGFPFLLQRSKGASGAKTCTRYGSFYAFLRPNVVPVAHTSFFCACG